LGTKIPRTLAAAQGQPGRAAASAAL